LEFKNVKNEKKKVSSSLLEQKAEEALNQIEELGYLSEIKQRGIKNVVKICSVFSGKGFRIKAKN
jgi:hypothetical protein